MPKQELDLFKLPACLVTKPCTGPPKIVWSYYADATAGRRLANDRPDYFRREALTMNLSCLAYGAEEYSIL